MAQGLNVGRLINISVNYESTPAQGRNFQTLLIIGDSDVIGASELIRSYTSLDEIASDFGVDAPEYVAARLYYAQSPTPVNSMVGRWFSVDSPAELYGGLLQNDEKLISTWNVITDGSFGITIGGVLADIFGLDFSLETNMNGIASKISDSLSVRGMKCVWTGENFIITTTDTGVNASLGYTETIPDGTDISAMLHMTSTTALSVSDGINKQTPLQALTELANKSGGWYESIFASTTPLTNDDHIAVASAIEAQRLTRVYTVGLQDANCKSAASTDDLGALLKALNVRRTGQQYSQTAFSIASAVGRANGVDFNGNNSMITLMYKQEPLIAAEYLTESEAQTLANKNINVLAYYDNNTAILQNGVMANGEFFDTIQGADALANDLQTNLYNALYITPTKIPQTEAGMTQLHAVIAKTLEKYVNNGYIAPGVYDGEGFGLLKTGQYLTNGYYIYHQPIALQSSADRAKRIAPTFTVAIKLAGAIHLINVNVNLNR